MSMLVCTLIISEDKGHSGFFKTVFLVDCEKFTDKIVSNQFTIILKNNAS